MSYSRRNFLRAATGAVAVAVSPPYVLTHSKTAPLGGNVPLKIIHFVSDGTSPSMVTITDRHSQLMRGQKLRWLELGKEDGAYMGVMDTSSLNSCVTDSSAASSAWGSGRKVMNGCINCYPDGVLLRPLYDLFGEAGWKRGLVTTSTLTDATPAGFAAATRDRYSSDLVADCYLKSGVDVLLGGGQDLFDFDRLLNYIHSGYQVVRTAEELKGASASQKLLGLFSAKYMPMSIDCLHDKELQEVTPTLAEMTTKALEVLGQSDRFILQVEGARVDHACHLCDAPGAVFDHLAFDDAVQVGIEYQKEHPETLLVVTADHGCGGPSLNGVGPLISMESQPIPSIERVDGSFYTLLPKLQTCENAVQVQLFIKEHFGVDVTMDKANLLLLARDGYNCVAYEPIKTLCAQLGQLLGNTFGISWGSVSHSGDHVLLVAKGPGAEKLRGPIDNTDIFKIYTGFAGIRFENEVWSGKMAPTALEIANRVLDEHGAMVSFEIKYQGVLEESTDLIHWNEVTDAQGGTFCVPVKGEPQRFFRYRMEN